MRVLLLRWLGLRICGACGCVVSKADALAHEKHHHDVRTGRMAGATYR